MWRILSYLQLVFHDRVREFAKRYGIQPAVPVKKWFQTGEMIWFTLQHHIPAIPANSKSRQGRANKRPLTKPRPQVILNKRLHAVCRISV